MEYEETLMFPNEEHSKMTYNNKWTNQEIKNDIFKVCLFFF